MRISGSGCSNMVCSFFLAGGGSFFLGTRWPAVGVQSNARVISGL